MRPLSTHVVSRILAIGLVISSVSFALGQEAKTDPAAALEIFFELGLPDTRGAKWVTSQGEEYSEAPLRDRYASGEEGGGNAWLLKEHPGGVVEVLLNQTQVYRAKRVSEDGEAAGELEGELKPVMIAPADLEKDASAFLSRLKKWTEEAKKSKEDNYQLENVREQTGSALLFLAHLQRQGRKDLVREALPMVLSLGGSPEATLDKAITLLANERLKGLARTWLKDGNAEAYARAVDELRAKFPRGWKEAPAAKLLAARLREKPALDKLPGDARTAAQVLLGLTDEQLQHLPFGRLWLLPPTGESESSGEFHSRPRHGYGRSRADGSHDNAPPPAVAKIFAEPRRAAVALAHLVADSRMTRAMRSDDGPHYSSYSYDFSPEMMDRMLYRSLPRPKELGEIARELLHSIAPEALNQQLGSDRPEIMPVVEWARSIEKLSDEELAWSYLRKAQSASETHFQEALQFLIAKGSDAAIAKLEEVFVDPAVWQGNDDFIFGSAQKYLARRGGDLEAVADKFKAAAKRSIEEQIQERKRYSSGDDEYKKTQEQQHAAFLKRFDRLLKPAKLGDLLDEIVEAEEDEAMALIQNLRPMLARTPPGEACGNILQATARAKTTSVKSALLGMAVSLTFNPNSGERRTDIKLPQDEASRGAIKTLLGDETVLPRNAWTGEEGESVADTTAQLLLSLEQDAAFGLALRKLASSAPVIVPKFAKERAAAIAQGTKLPDLPDAARVPEAETQRLLMELSGMGPADCLESFKKKTLDEQLALITHLRKSDVVWPPSIRSAHLMVVNAWVSDDAEFDGQKWKGRVLDMAACRELSEAVEKAALDGNYLMLQARSQGVLGGLTIQVAEMERTFAPKELERLSIKTEKTPDFVFGTYTQTVSEKEPAYVTSIQPFWNDRALTDAWRQKQESATPNESEQNAQRRRGLKSRKEVVRAMEEFFELKPESRGAAIRLGWYAAKVDESRQKSPDEE